MTKNQIELIKAREMERANRAQEEIATSGQNKSLVGQLAGSVFRGLATTLIPSRKAATAATVGRHIYNTVHINNYRNRRNNNNNNKGGNNNAKE